MCRLLNILIFCVLSASLTPNFLYLWYSLPCYSVHKCLLSSLSLSLSNTHTQSFDLDAPTVTHTDPLSHRLNTDDKVPHSLSASPLSEERLLLATSRGSAIKVSGVSQGSGHPWTAGQCRVQDPKPGSASGTLWITLVKQGIRNL